MDLLILELISFTFHIFKLIFHYISALVYLIFVKRLLIICPYLSSVSVLAVALESRRILLS